MVRAEAVLGICPYVIEASMADMPIDDAVGCMEFVPWL